MGDKFTTIRVSKTEPNILTDNITYLYGYGRVGEYTGDWSYYTTDTLGSARQIVDSTGMVQYYQSYEPYGDVLASAGQGGSNYGYANEWTDATGLQYLRARYYNTGIGRFTTRDTWAGNYYDPLSLNRWAYVQGNAINYVDPSGLCPEGTTGSACRQLAYWLESEYEITFYWPGRITDFELKLPDEIKKGLCRLFNGIKESDYPDIDAVIKYWETQTLLDIEEALTNMVQVYGLDEVKNITRDGAFIRADKVASGAKAFYCDKSNCGTGGHNRFDFTASEYVVGVLDSFTGKSDEWKKYAIIHEFGHRVLYQIGFKYANDMWNDFYDPGNLPSDYAGKDQKPREYFAETFAAFTFQKANLGAIPRDGSNSLHVIKDINGKNISLDDYFDQEIFSLVGAP